MEWFIKANLNLAVFFLIYVLIIRFTGRHVWARIYLLAVPAISVLLPVVMLNTVVTTTLPVVYLEAFSISAKTMQYAGGETSALMVLYAAYFMGVGISMVFTIVALVKLAMKRNSVRTAFSFFGMIRIPETTGEKGKMMLLHEQAHMKQWHSIDTVWYAVVRAVFWINPTVYKLFAYLKEEHEYSADAYAIEKLGDRITYCDLLLDETFNVDGVSQLAHSFHSHTLYNRIKMITQTQPQYVAWWKRIVTVPLLGMLFFVSVMGTQTFAQKVEGEIFDSKGGIPEIMPEFPGGQENMMKFLSTELKYPEKCRDQKIEGRVILQFVVDKNGRIQNVKNLKEGVDPLLVKEAMRVVSAMPKWNPGQHKGEAVNTEMVLPIVFKL